MCLRAIFDELLVDRRPSTKASVNGSERRCFDDDDACGLRNRPCIISHWSVGCLLLSTASQWGFGLALSDRNKRGEESVGLPVDRLESTALADFCFSLFSFRSVPFRLYAARSSNPLNHYHLHSRRERHTMMQSVRLENSTQS